MPNVLVIDVSASVRETLRIVLGYEHAVTAIATVDELPRGVVPDVVVLGIGRAEPERSAVARTLSGALAGVPLLFLHAAREVEAGAFVRTDAPVDFLAKPFDAYAIRERVRRLLKAHVAAARAAGSDRVERRWLEPPWITVGNAEVARRVVASGLDVVLVRGESGTGRLDVARALHAAGSCSGPFVVVDARRAARGDIARTLSEFPRSGATMYVEDIDRASHELLMDLAALIRSMRDGSRTLRAIVGSERDLFELASEGVFPSDLAHALSVVPIVLAPLRDRRDDVPALVDALTRTWAARLGLGAVSYRPTAIERLQAYLWFGNVAELEAVVLRTLVLHRPTLVEPEHLVFVAEDAERAVARPVPTASTGRARDDAAGAMPSPRPAAGKTTVDLEVLVGELAHELRNPMVTIKTVAQHLDGILADPEARARFSTLMADAVGRMDGVVETLLDFARFRAPVRGPVDLRALLDRVLDEHGDELARRQVRVERSGDDRGTVEADPAQLEFAVRCLLRGFLPSLIVGSTVDGRIVAADAFEIGMRAEPSVASRLASWVDPAADGFEEAAPLWWVLAAALLARNGAALTVRKGDDQAVVVRVDWADGADERAVERTEG